LFFTFFFNFRRKNTVNTEVVDASEAQNHGIYDVFFSLIANTTVLTVIFGQHLAKTSWYLRSFHYVARSCFFHAAVYKLQSFGFCHTPKEQQKSIKKCHKCTFQTLLGSMPRFIHVRKTFDPLKT